MPSARARFARCDARKAAKPKVLKDDKINGSSASSTSDESAMWRRPGRKRRVEWGRASRFKQLKDDGSTRAGRDGKQGEKERC